MKTDHIKKRNLVMQVVLMIVTLGFYSIYWFHVTLKGLMGPLVIVKADAHRQRQGRRGGDVDHLPLLPHREPARLLAPLC